VASGCQFVKHRKAAAELINLGLVDERRLPRFTGAQALGCSPVAGAFERGSEVVQPVRPATIAIGNPSDGADVLRIARRTGGVVASVPEEEIVEGIELLATTEGIFTVAAYITGHGLKTLDALAGRQPLGDAVEPQRRGVHRRLGELGIA
jgi:threonine synthase